MNSVVGNTAHMFPHSVKMISDEDTERIVNSAFELIWDHGVKFDPHQRAFGLFQSAGCIISTDGMVKFPTTLVRDCLESAGKQTKLWNRSGTEYRELSLNSTLFEADGSCPNFIDPITGERRPGTEKDLATSVRVADALDNIDAVGYPCFINEKPGVPGEVAAFVSMVSNTTKPLVYGTQYVEPLEAAIKISAVIRGGLKQLQEKPYFVYWVPPLPFYFPSNSTEQLFMLAENDIPMVIGCAPIGGISGPITIAGNLVNGLATSFAGITLAQLVSKGCFCMEGSLPAFMDPAKGSISAIPEAGMANMARTYVDRTLGFPSLNATAGIALSPQFNQESACVGVLSMMQALCCPSNIYLGLGSIETSLTYSLQFLLYCNELVGIFRRMGKGFNVNNDCLAIDVTKEVGIDGLFALHLHTADNCRDEIWQTRYLKGSTMEEWEKQGRPDLVDKINADLHHILNTHHPESISDKIKNQIRAISAQYDAPMQTEK